MRKILSLLLRLRYYLNPKTMPQMKHWEEGWAAGRTAFHHTEVHELLLEFKDKLLVKQPSRVLVPLCGKSVDMKWFADQGHEVVGVEGVTEAVLDFFQEQSLPYTESDVPGLENGKLFQTSDGKIKIYKCDIFNLSKDVAGWFDAVWDRASLTAIDPPLQPKYSEVILSLLAPGARILLETFVYNTEEFKGPPQCTPDETVKELYGEKCTLELLADNDMLPKAPRFRTKYGMSWARQHAHLILLK